MFSVFRFVIFYIAVGMAALGSPGVVVSERDLAL